MMIGITGATGFIGREVAQKLVGEGHKILRFSRGNPSGQGRFSLTEPVDVSGCEGLVHLAGESVLGLWTREKRRRILESRIEGTRRLVEGIAALPAEKRPSVLVSASAIGFYGNTGESIADEDAPAGEGFLAEVAQAWEEEALKAVPLGVRVVMLRIGFVLGRGGAMRLIAPVFRAGLGGRLGSGRQWMSCIAVSDLVSMVGEALQNKQLSGPVNAVMPDPLRNAAFTQEIARAVHRPALFPAPAAILRLVLGDLSQLLLNSQRIVPKRLLEAGFVYRYPTPASVFRELF